MSYEAVRAGEELYLQVPVLGQRVKLARVSCKAKPGRRLGATGTQPPGQLWFSEPSQEQVSWQGVSYPWLEVCKPETVTLQGWGWLALRT